MATYHYACDNCTLDDLKASKKEIRLSGPIIIVKSGTLVWEEKHGMTEEPKIKCPLCGKKASRTMEGIGAPIWYIKGNCYLNRADCKRQMDLHKLETGQDPYGYMRQPGEVDEIKKNLKNPNKSKPKYFTT